MPLGVLPEGEDQTHKALYFAGASSERRDVPAALHRFKEGDVTAEGIIGDPADRCLADPALGNVQDAARGDLVTAVVHRLEVGDHIPDFPAVVEIGSAHHIVGDRLEDKALFKGTGLRVGPVEDREVPVAEMTVISALAVDILRDKGRFVPGRRKFPQMDRRSFPLVRPELFLLALRVISDHRIGCVENALCGAVVLLKAHHERVGVILLKVQDILNIGAAEAVNGLVVVADHAEIPVFLRKEPHQFKLRVVGVLVLVHHDVEEAVLIGRQHLFVRVKEFHRAHEKIVKIQRVVLFEPLLVLLVGVRDLLVPEAVTCVLLPVLERRDQLVLRGRDLGKDGSLPELLGVDLQVLAHFLHQRFLVVRIIDRKRGLIAQKFYMAAQDPDAHGMECGDPDALRAESDQIVDTLSHLARRLIGKGDGENIPGIYAAVIQKIGDPVCDHPRLSASGPREDQNRPLRMPDRFPLLFIQSVINRHKFVVTPYFLLLLTTSGTPGVSSRSFSMRSFLR